MYYFTLSSTYANNSTRYTLQMAFDPSNEELTTNMSPGNIDESGTITTITNEMKNATITVGGNGINNNNNMGSMIVHSFSVTKG